VSPYAPKTLRPSASRHWPIVRTAVLT
jgi:hypothetical protein